MKYTVFDNFDKLDLSPIASKLDSEAINETSVIIEEAINKNSINLNNYNETVFSNLNNKIRPIAYNSKDMIPGSIPDMFWYITNNRFYIGNNGDVFHTSIIKTALDAGAKDFFDDFLLESNMFYNKYFFNVFLRNFNSIFSDAIRLYKNPFYTPGVDGNYNASIQNYFKFGVENQIFVNVDGLPIQASEYNPDALADDLYNLYQYDPPNSNVPTFFNEDILQNFKLFIGELFPPQDPDFSSVLSFNGPNPELGQDSIKIREQAILFLKRLIYPYKALGQAETSLIPIHNYYVSDLEKSTSVNLSSRYNYTPNINLQNVTLEWQLPSLNAYVSYMRPVKLGLLSNQKYYKDIISLDSKDNFKIDDFSIERYYNISNNSQDYLNAQDSDDSDGYLQFYKLLKHQTTIYGSNFHLLESLNLPFKKLFPMATEIELPNIKSDIMSDLDATSRDVFMTLISNYFSSLNTPEKSAVHTFSMHDKEPGSVNISLTDLQLLDISLLNDPEDVIPLLFLHSNRFAYEDTSLLNTQSDQLTAYESKIKQTSDLVFDYCKQKQLDYTDVRDGKKCHSEILAFEVVKYATVDGEKTRLQSFFVPCHKDLAKTIIDTQVFYDKEYTYEVFSISLVVGCKYVSESYVPPSQELQDGLLKTPAFNPDQPNTAVEYLSLSKAGKLPTDSADNTKNYTILKPILIRAPYFNTVSITNNQISTIILDKPPLPPDISFLPYKDIDNKVLITLDVNYGQRRLTPVEVFPEDAEQIQKHFQNQIQERDNPLFGPIIDTLLTPLTFNLLTYKTDDFKGLYKIWRTTKKPINWSVFSNSTPTVIDNTQNTAFEDDILPNVDYYYFARFEDVNGNFSNPTSLYYLRMVKEGGFPPYLIVKPYSFGASRPPLVYEKTFKKFLKVRLANGTREFYNTSQRHLIDFGYKKASSTSQLKKYKLRITSKKTGKKIDINIDFKKDVSDQFLQKPTLIENSAIPETKPKAETDYEKVQKSNDFKKTEQQFKTDAKQVLSPPMGYTTTD